MTTNEQRARASEMAADWRARFQARDLSEAECEQFVDWLRESPAHVAEMLLVGQVDQALSQFRGWSRIATADIDGWHDNVVALPGAAAHLSSKARRRGPRRIWSTALAVTVCAAAAAGLWFLQAAWIGQTIETDRGERREVALDDGSVVQVDSQTRLRVDFGRSARRIRLERGRALFRVAKDPGRSFVVRADGTLVRAVGTSFGVEHERGGIVVTVMEGTVAVVPEAQTGRPARGATAGLGGTSAAAGTGPTARPTREVLLDADQQLTIQRSGSAASVRLVDSSRELAWAQGRLVLDNDDIATAIDEFNRYNRIQLQVSDPKLAQLRVSGVFNASDPESFVVFLQAVAPIAVIRNERFDITLVPAEQQ